MLVIRSPFRMTSLYLILFTIIMARTGSSANWQTLWQIGRFDGSSAEFKSGPSDYADPSQDPVFEVGKSDPANNWYGYQPGSANGVAGNRPHPFTIRFDLPEIPRGLYRLKVALIVVSPRLPRLQADINGHRGWFYQHPQLSYVAGDLAGVFLPAYGTTSITVDLPARFLNKGPNKLVLTAVDEPGERDDARATIILGNSAIVYDALQLDRDPEGKASRQSVSVKVVPTIFYRTKGDHLVEVVDAFVRFGERPYRGRVDLTVGGTKFSQTLETDREFGEQLVEFEVPEFSSPSNGDVIVRTNGRTSHHPIDLKPAKKWNVFVVPNEHLDVGYSDYQSKVAEIHARVIDEAMQLIKKHPDFRFNLDSYWEVEQFLNGRSGEDQKLFLQFVRDGKIFVPAQYTSNLTGFPTVENLIRSLYGSHRFHSQHGGKFDHANITDVPSYSWSYASVLAAAGLRYFIAASNNYRAPVLLHGRLHEKSPFWWEGPDGGRILMWYSRLYQQVACLFGLPPQISAGRDSLPSFLQNYSHADYQSDAVLLFGTQEENTDLHPSQAAMVDAWNRVYAYPRLRFSGFSEALDYIVRQFDGKLPVVRGDGGPYWEDGIASDAYYAALARENEHRALAAEKFSTVSALIDPRIHPDRVALKRMWEDLLLFDEHTWESAHGTSDPNSLDSIRQRRVKDSRAIDGQLHLEKVLERGMAAIAEYIQQPSGTVVVFNPLNWQRSGLVEIDLNKGFELTDLTANQPVSYEILATGNSYHHIRFNASDVPAVGYKCFAMRRASPKAERLPSLSGNTLENRYYRVALDPESGSVKSLFDKELGKELVEADSPYRLGQYVYVTGGDKRPNRLLEYTAVAEIPKLETHGAKDGRLVSVTQAPFGMIARLESSSINTPRIETEIILFDNQKKIEFINRVTKTKVFTKEGVYFAFPFAMAKPRFRYEIQNGFVDPSKDLLPGAGHEWFSVQHWVAADQDGVTSAVVPVDAGLVTLGDVVRGTWPTTFGARRGTMFSYVMNNYWETNFVGGQGGNFTFRYILTSGSNLTPQDLSRLGWEEACPLEVNEIRSQDKAVTGPRPFQSAAESFLDMDQPNLVFVTWKLAEDAAGTILRFVETGGESGAATVATPLVEAEHAWLCNAVEENQQPLKISPEGVTFPFKPYQIITLRLQGEPLLRPN